MLSLNIEKILVEMIRHVMFRYDMSDYYEGLEVQMAGNGDMGYSIATVTTTFQDSLGNDFGGANRDLHIWKKENGEWKVVVDIWNTPAPALQNPTN